MTRRELRAQGEATLKDLFGSDEQTRGLANLLTEPVYLPEQVAKFGQSALSMGLSPTEVVEAIIQTAPATGFPPALNALGAISTVFR